jgi:hypothetical protein
MFSFSHHNAHQNANGAHHNGGCVNLASLIHLLSRVQELNPWEISNNLTQRHLPILYLGRNCFHVINCFVINPLGSWFSYHFLLQTMKISGPILWYRVHTCKQPCFPSKACMKHECRLRFTSAATHEICLSTSRWISDQLYKTTQLLPYPLRIHPVANEQL